MFLSNGTIVPTPGGTLGDFTPQFTDASYYSGSHIQLENTFASYGALYRAQLWVGIVVRKRAMATARMPFDILKKGAGILKSAEAGPLAALMENPNPEMSAFDLWQWTSSTRDIYGEAFWRKVRGPNNEVRELWPMHPANVIVRRNKETSKLEYVYAAAARSAQGVDPIPAEDVVAFLGYNPDTTARGLSNLESLRMTLLNEDASRRATAAFWRKGARPSIILTHPNSLSEPAQARLKKQAEANMAGADNTGSVSLFEEGIVPHLTQLNMEEMQYVEGRRLNREEVCAAYDISPLVVHILDHATFSNVTEQLRSQYRDTMAPWFTELEAAVNRQLVPDFYPSTGSTRVVTRFNMDDVLRGDYETRSTAATTMRQGGITTGNEARVIMGLEPIDDPNMNIVFANSALQVLGAAKPQLALPAGSSSEPVPPDGQDVPAPVKHGMVPNKPREGGKGFLSRRAKAAIAKAAGARARMIEAHTETLAKYFTDLQAAAVKATGSKAALPVDWAEWDDNLAEILLPMTREIANSAGEVTALKLGGSYDVADLENWLAENSKSSSKLINKSLADLLSEAMEAAADDIAATDVVDSVFEETLSGRPGEIAASIVAGVGAFAAHDSAKANGGLTKTWVVNSARPRASHADMDGESVPVDDVFSNGMQYPGDWAGGADEVAGCQCTTDYSKDE